MGIITGTESSDFLQGTEDSDELSGLGGDDVLQGEGGDDILDGGAGADQLAGGAGDDVYVVEDPGDVVVEADGEGEDEVRTGLDFYVLPDHVERLRGMSETAQVLTGNGLSNSITGGSAADVLDGGAGSDVLEGGLGDDLLAGGAGSDVYRFMRGDGNDRIEDGSGSGDRNAIEFYYGILPENLTVTQSGLDIVLTLDQDGGSITLVGQLDPASDGTVSEVLFLEGGFWDYGEIVARSLVTTEDPDSLRGGHGDDLISGWGGDDLLDGGRGDDNLEGGDGDDSLKGGAGVDILEGGAGDDLLAGGEGNDVFRFQPGFGQDVVADSSGSAGGGFDRIEFLAQILPGDLTISVDGSDVLISIGGTSDSIRIKDMLSDPAAIVEELAFADGTVLHLPYLVPAQHQYGTAADDVLTGDTLGNILHGNGGDDRLEGGSGRDEIVGGTGDDLLVGGADGDLYVFNAGDGNDVIRDEGGAGMSDLLIIGGGLQRSDTTVGRSADGLSFVLYFHGGEESITLYGAATADPRYRIETINFQFGMLRGVTLASQAMDVSNGDDVLTANPNFYFVRGLGGDDIIHGTAGGDWLRGDSGDDTLNGGDGNDQLNGDSGDDTMTGGSGDDSYQVYEVGDSVVEAEGEGNDQVSTSLAAYVLPDHVERLVGVGQGAQVLTGNDGDNSIEASWGDDILEGAGGDDSLAGGGGSDVYRFARGDGDDVVTEIWTGNAIEFAADILPGDVTVTLSGSDIILTVDGDGGSITWVGGRDSADVVEVRFANGTVWSYAQLIDTSLVGGAGADVMTGNESDNSIRGMGGDDVLIGAGGHDVLEGGTGSDLLDGGSGYDIYRFERGFGRDEIAKPDDYSYDRIEFMGDILPGEVSVWTTGDGGDLLFTLAGTTDRILVRGAFSHWSWRIDEVAFADGTVWSYVDLLAMALPAPVFANEQVGTAGDDILVGGASGDILRGEGGEDSLDGGDGSDELHGGSGQDGLSGGAGDDYYHYSAGDGHDTVHEAGGYDTVRIGAGLTRDDLTVGLSSDGLSYILYFGGGEGSITLDGAATPADDDEIEYIRFADGAAVAGASLAALALNVGNGDDVVTIGSGMTILHGLGGDDSLYGSSGDERLEGDSGDDVLSGGDGVDELVGGSGADLLIGGSGDDLYLDVNDALDAVVETDGGGQDEIRTALAVYALPDHVERLIGQSGQGQELTGNAGANVVYGGAGDDILSGGLGNDHLAGTGGSNIYRFSRGDGDDWIHVEGPASSEDDVLQFGPGILPGNVTVTQSSLDIVITLDQSGGSVSLDRYYWSFTGLSQVIFADGTVWSREELLARSMIGTAKAEWLTGEESDDLIMGMGANDLLFGLAGDDVLNGGDGDDWLGGGSGADLLTGGAGADQFALGQEAAGAEVDRITDFVAGEDRIALQYTSYPNFTFIGGSAFSGTAGEFRYWFDGTDTWVQLDTYGTGSASAEIVLSGNVVLTASDFYF